MKVISIVCMLLAIGLILYTVPAIAQDIGDDDSFSAPAVEATAALARHVINGTVYCDSNRNGRLDASEGIVPGVTIKLYNSAGTLTGTTTTNSVGVYAFTVSKADKYTIKESVPDVYMNTTLTKAKVNIKAGTAYVTANFMIAPYKGYVTLGGDNALAVVDIVNDGFIKRIPLPESALSIAYSSDHKKAYAITNHSICVIDTGSDTVTKTIFVGTSLVSAQAAPGVSEVYVNDTTGKIYVIDMSTDTIKKTLSFSYPITGMYFAATVKKAYVTDGYGNLSAINTATNTIAKVLSTSNTYVEYATFSPDGKFLYVCVHFNPTTSQDWVYKISTSTDKSVGCITPNIAVTYSGYQANIFRVEAMDNISLMGFDRNGYAYYIDSATFRITSGANLGTGVIDTASLPSNQYVYVLESGGRIQWVMPLKTGSWSRQGVYVSGGMNDLMFDPYNQFRVFMNDPSSGVISYMDNDHVVHSIGTTPGRYMVFRPDNRQIFQSQAYGNTISVVDIVQGTHGSITVGTYPGPVVVL